jgi:hypothetical protein
MVVRSFETSAELSRCLKLRAVWKKWTPPFGRLRVVSLPFEDLRAVSQFERSNHRI